MNQCANCGYQLSPDGRCVNCGWSMMPAYPMNYKKSGSGRLIAVTVAVLAVLAGVILMIVGLVKTVQAGNDSKKKTEETTNIVTIEEIDVKVNLEELGSITGEESVKQASLMTEEEAVKEFAMRGFTEEPIFIYCDMDGEYIGKTEISATGSQKHPSYETYYKTPSEGIWCIKLIGDTLYATPLSWYEDKSWSVPHMLSEAEDYKTYDSKSKMFYTLKPYESELVIKHLDRINTDALDSLTAQEVEE